MLTDPVPPTRLAVSSHVHIYVSDVDSTYRKTIKASGIAVQKPVKKQDENKRGAVKDPGGTTWWISTMVE